MASRNVVLSVFLVFVLLLVASGIIVLFVLPKGDKDVEHTDTGVTHTAEEHATPETGVPLTPAEPPVLNEHPKTAFLDAPDLTPPPVLPKVPAPSPVSVILSPSDVPLTPVVPPAPAVTVARDVETTNSVHVETKAPVSGPAIGKPTVPDTKGGSSPVPPVKGDDQLKPAVEQKQPVPAPQSENNDVAQGDVGDTGGEKDTTPKSHDVGDGEQLGGNSDTVTVTKAQSPDTKHSDVARNPSPNAGERGSEVTSVPSNTEDASANARSGSEGTDETVSPAPGSAKTKKVFSVKTNETSKLDDNGVKVVKNDGCPSIGFTEYQHTFKDNTWDEFAFNDEVLKGIPAVSNLTSLYVYTKTDGKTSDKPLLLKLHRSDSTAGKTATDEYYAKGGSDEGWIKVTPAFTEIPDKLNEYDYKLNKVVTVNFSKKLTNSGGKYGYDNEITVTKDASSLSGYSKFTHKLPANTQITAFKFVENGEILTGLPTDSTLTEVSVYFKEGDNSRALCVQVKKNDNNVETYTNEGHIGWKKEENGAGPTDGKLKATDEKLSKILVLDLGKLANSSSTNKVATFNGTDVTDVTSNSKNCEGDDNGDCKVLSVAIGPTSGDKKYTVGRFLCNDKLLTGLPPGEYTGVYAHIPDSEEDPTVVKLQTDGNDTEGKFYTYDGSKWTQVQSPESDANVQKLKEALNSDAGKVQST